MSRALGFPLLPLGADLDGRAVGRLLSEGPGWQVCATDHSGQVALLLDAGVGEPDWRRDELAALDAVAALSTTAGEPQVRWLLLASGERAVSIGELSLRSGCVGEVELDAAVRALSALVERRPAAAWRSALLLPGVAFALGTQAAEAEDRRGVLLELMSGGVQDADLTPARVRRLNPRLTEAQIARALAALGDAAPVQARRPVPAPEGFTVPGHPQLEALLRERVIDVLHRRERYAALGVPAPNGVLLSGPPGCGKSFAAERLAVFLGWPVHAISLAEVGSKWLHETAGRLSAAFDAAARDAPAIVLLEEVDALGAARSHGRVALDEEVNALLRLVERASARGLLVVATTNRLEAVDPALRRAGRFDSIVAMDHPDAAGAAAMLELLLAGRPLAAGVDVAGLGRRLARRPASDLAWVVNEAARRTARSGNESIDEMALARAAAELPPR